MEFAPFEPVIPTEREKALQWILDLHFPFRTADDHRQLFISSGGNLGSYNSMQAPGDQEVIQRFSNFGELPEGDEILAP